MKSAKTHNDRNKIYREKIWKLIKDRGLIQTLKSQLSKQYFRLFDHRTFFTKQMPGGMKEKYRFSSTQIVGVLLKWNDFIWAITLIGFGTGLWVVVQLGKPPNWVQLFVGIVFYNIIIFLSLHVKTRYVIQFLPMLTIISTMGLKRLWFCLFSRHSSSILKYQHTELKTIIFGLLLSGLLLFFAFHDVFL